jgi:hypothetical protein
MAAAAAQCCTGSYAHFFHTQSLSTIYRGNAFSRISFHCRLFAGCLPAVCWPDVRQLRLGRYRPPFFPRFFPKASFPDGAKTQKHTARCTDIHSINNHTFILNKFTNIFFICICYKNILFDQFSAVHTVSVADRVHI